jgi:hypothetical protein
MQNTKRKEKNTRNPPHEQGARKTGRGCGIVIIGSLCWPLLLVLLVLDPVLVEILGSFAKVYPGLVLQCGKHKNDIFSPTYKYNKQ